jgi:LPXTG-motif cell wall-anchored protein
MTINKRSKTVRHGSTLAIALAFAFGAAFLTPAASFAAEPQDSVVTDVLVMPCSKTDRYTAVIEGIFLSPITSVLVDGFVVDSSLWAQNMFDLTINMPPSIWSSHTLDIVNGRTPTMVQETLYCAGAEVLPTESGGSIPSTGTNNYNNLLGGVALLLIASVVVILRKRIVTN